MVKLLFHQGDELLCGALSHGNGIVRSADMNAYAALAKGSGDKVNTLLQRSAGHIKMIVTGRIKVFPGEKVDGILQAFKKILVKDAVCFVAENIIISKALPGNELVEKLPGIL